VQLDELLSKNITHLVYVTGMGPVRIMHTRERYPLIVAFVSCTHHVSRVNWVNEIWWESCILFRFVYRLLINVISNCNILQSSLDNVFRCHVFVWLHTGQSHRRDPFDWITSWCNNFCTFCEPFLNLVCITEQVSDTLNRYLGQILGSSIEISVCAINSFVFKLSLDLLSCTDKGYTIHRGHNSLLDNLTGNIAFQTFGNLDEILIIFCFNVLLYKLENGCIYITRPFSILKVDLSSTIWVSSKRGIMLHTIAGSIDMDM